MLSTTLIWSVIDDALTKTEGNMKPYLRGNWIMNIDDKNEQLKQKNVKINVEKSKSIILYP